MTNEGSAAMVLEAMRSVGREDAMRELWGEVGFARLVEYLAVACAPTEVGMSTLRDSIVAHPVRKTMVLTGERCSGADLDEGTDSPILTGLAPVMEMLAPVSCLRSEERTGREPNALSLIFSGGVTLTPEMGELPGNVMAEQFNRMTDNVYRDVVGADSFSMNTGDQGRTLAAIAFARKIERIVFCHVIDHVARFGATVTAALQELVDAENERIDRRCADIRAMWTDMDMSGHDAANAIEKLNAARRVMPELVFVALGDWIDRDPRRGRDNDGDGILRAREAFGPMQSPEEAMYPGKRLGSEYADRYFAEQDGIRNIGFACPALSPAAMLNLLGR